MCCCGIILVYLCAIRSVESVNDRENNYVTNRSEGISCAVFLHILYVIMRTNLIVRYNVHFNIIIYRVRMADRPNSTKRCTLVWWKKNNDVAILIGMITHIIYGVHMRTYGERRTWPTPNFYRAYLQLLLLYIIFFFQSEIRENGRKKII